MAPKQPEEQWHLDKKVPLSLIFAMLIQAAMAILAYADIKKDVELLKASSLSSALAQHERDEQQDKAQSNQMQVVTKWLERIDAKLDRLADRKK